MIIDPDVGSLLVAALALLFLSAAWHKLRHPQDFAAALAAYRLLPDALVSPLARTIPVVEVAGAAGLLWPPGRAFGAAVVAALLLAYAVAIGINLARGRRDVDCGCGGFADRQLIAPWMVVRNVLFAVAAGTAGGPWSNRALTATDVLTVAGGLAAIIPLYLAADHLLGQVMPRGAMLRRS